jgi:hypothetical protein
MKSLAISCLPLGLQNRQVNFFASQRAAGHRVASDGRQEGAWRNTSIGIVAHQRLEISTRPNNVSFAIPWTMRRHSFVRYASLGASVAIGKNTNILGE